MESATYTSFQERLDAVYMLLFLEGLRECSSYVTLLEDAFHLMFATLAYISDMHDFILV